MLKISDSIHSDTNRLAKRPGNVFTIASGSDFLALLVDAILTGRIFPEFLPERDPQILSTLTIYVPNRRAARELTTCFLDASKNKATFLPKIRVLGDVDDDEFDLETSIELSNALPQSINSLERRIELTKLIQAWVSAMSDETRRFFGDEDIAIPSSQADALYLADDLCILLAQMTQEEVDWKTIREIVPEEHAEWWRLTATFLKIIMEHWPEYLESIGLVDPAQKTALKLKLRAEIFEQKGSEGPVIVAGSTGSIRSTQRLLKAVADLPNGAVVLPGLDLHMSKKEWGSLCEGSLHGSSNLETHPQFGLAQLLLALQTDRENVVELDILSKEKNLCRQIVGQALSAATETGAWFELSKAFNTATLTKALSGISYINATNERQEATAIAVAMREVLETAGKTAALVTPDRNLASRVAVELHRFGIDVDDTGGTPLRNAKPSLFLRQIVKLAFEDQPGNLAITTVLKNTLSTGGFEPNEAMKLARLFELVALRGSIHSPKLGAFHPFLLARRQFLNDATHISAHIRNMSEDRWHELFRYTEQLDIIFSRLADARAADVSMSLSSAISRLFEVAQLLSSDTKGSSSLLDNEGGEELQKLHEDVISTQAGSMEVRLSEFPAVFDALLASGSVRPRFSKNPRLHIFGPLEVRLLNHNRVILAGLNEATWPQATRNDPFLNRIMRQGLGMASPERRTGLAAHDFQQLLGKDEVILSRASRVDKAPTVASRWLQRLFALIGEEQLNHLSARGKWYLDLASHIDEDKPTMRVKRPCPKPPIDARPTTLPVTAIETWIRDPYALYADRILKLQPLDPLEREPDARLKGTLYHAIMQDYIESDVTQDSEKERLDLLLTIANERIEEEALPTETERVWKSRFQEIATKYISWETEYQSRHHIRESACEIKGTITIGDDFTLTARADRVDVFENGEINVIDYKTGASPSPKQARNLSPQLALEGLIAQRHGFSDIEEADLFDLVYMRLMQGSKFKAERIADDKKHTIQSIIDNATAELIKLIEGFKDPDQGYISRRAPFLESEMSNDYDHLARTREWSFGEEGDGDE